MSRMAGNLQTVSGKSDKQELCKAGESSSCRETASEISPTKLGLAATPTHLTDVTWLCLAPPLYGRSLALR